MDVELLSRPYTFVINALNPSLQEKKKKNTTHKVPMLPDST